jgi:predicted HTH transcriptional regulator
MAFFFKHLSLSGKIVGFTREEKLEVPAEALREALTNACLCKCLHKQAYVKSHIMSSSATNNKKCYCESKRCA